MNPIRFSFLASVALIFSIGRLFATVTSIDEPRFNIVPVVVTSDSAGSHTTTNGVNAFSVDHHGVGEFSSGTNNCTGSLLSDGRSVLTAAHCVTPPSASATFVNAAGTPFSQTATGSALAINPSYDGNVIHGHDIAVVTFPTTFDPSIPRYEIVSSGFDAIGQQGVVFGFGMSGIGSTGGTIARGTKRAGLIEYESLGLGTKGEAGWLNDNTQLVADFDSGLAANDAFNVVYGDPADLGFGNDEVGFATGDSGGPTFYMDGGAFRIGAVSSWVANDTASDVLVGTSFTWGEFNGSANLGESSMNAFVINAIPEPGPVSLMAWALGMIGIRRRR